MFASELIDYIIINDKIEEILNSLGCHHINSSSSIEYRCALPNHKNNTSVVVKKETLKTRVYWEEETIYGDIFTLTMFIKDCIFPESIKYLHTILGLEYTKYNNKKEEKKDNPLDVFLKVKPKKRHTIDVNDIKFINEEFISDYEPHLHISWLREGITSKTARKFNIGFDWGSRRIVIPHRYYMGDEHDYIGIIGRTVLPDEYCELFDIPKYYPLKKYPKSCNLYALNENYKTIQEAGVCVVFEAEKSPLKRHSRLDETAVAICCHDLSPEQMKILIGLNVEIVIAYDKDVSLHHIRSQCENFYQIRKVSYIYDQWGIMGEKDSPADMPDKIYKFLFKHRIVYNEKEHVAYLKEKEEREKKMVKKIDG